MSGQELQGCGPDCPPAEALIALIEGRLTGAQRDDVLAACAACAHCSASLRVLRSMRAAAEQTAEQAARSETPVHRPAPSQRRPRRLHWLSLAAGVAVAAWLLPTWLQHAPTTTDTVRSVPSASDPADGAKLDHYPTQWRWPAGATERYRVTVYDGDGLQVQQFEATAPQARVQPPADLMPGRYVWEVESDQGREWTLMGSWYFDWVAAGPNE